MPPMSRIRILPPEVVGKIAAGEVVERPASVVKELLENALDAGARSVRVEIRDGGKKLIRVSDDGAGIDADELPLSVERHATSKLQDAGDLERISTLGFRGEALASIGAVSRLSILSRPHDRMEACEVVVEGGEHRPPAPRGGPAGTIVTVENLFYNVPARLKFTRSASTEAGYVHRMVSRYALAYPEIRFQLVGDGRMSFRSEGSGELRDAIIAVFGVETARKMLELPQDEEPGSIAVSGYVGDPSLSRADREWLILFINRRLVQDRSLSMAVAQAYHTFLMSGRHPVAVINVHMPHEEVDVNVHPAKSEVRFRSQNEVFGAVQRKVRAAIISGASVPQLSSGAYRPSDRDFVSTGSTRLALEAQRTLRMPADEEADVMAQPLLPSEDLPMLRVVGQVQQAYIVAEGPDGMYMIDQHAAHERILYDKMKKEYEEHENTAQALLEPATVELTPAQAALLENEADTLASVGFDVEPFGGTTYIVRSVPAIMAGQNAAGALSDVLAEMVEGFAPLAKEADERLIITICKRAAVKAGQTLSHEEMRSLVRQLEETSAPRTCPHGRPTMIHISTSRIAYQFGRH